MKELAKRIENEMKLLTTSQKLRHGLSGHKLYKVWCDMINRTSNINYSKFHNYGGRGITVCDRWMDISNFIEDMYPTYKDGLAVDRVDVNGNYEPSNCRWSTRTTQNRNTRKIYSHNTSGYRGVTFDKSKKQNNWKAQIRINSCTMYLGYFYTAIEAASAYDNYVIENKLEHTINGAV